MAIDYHFLKNYPFEDRQHVISQRDTILYALGIGVGYDPVDERQLRFLYEKDLVAVPAMGAVLALPAPWVNRPESGITWGQMLHGEQGLKIHRPLPTHGTLYGRTHIEEIVDKGAGKGALIYTSRTVYDQATDTPIVTATQTLFCRADGGFGGPVSVARPVHSLPETPCDLVCDLPTLPQAALIYRLSGDVNPLHIDPAVAHEAGFDRPILHGLCSFGVATHAILRAVLNYQAERLAGIKVRFSSPVYPGETIRTEIWRESKNRVSFRCKVLERDAIVINNGCADLH